MRVFWLVAFLVVTGIQLHAQAPNGAWPTVLNDLKQGQSPTLLDDGSRLMTRAAYDLLLEHEVGGGQDYYDKYLISPTWPKEHSGVTIGVGYDLGYVTAQEFYSDWQPYLDSATLQRLASCIGITGGAASHQVGRVSNIRIPWEVARKVFITRTLPRTYQETLTVFHGFENLPADAQGALVSLVLNRGTELDGDTRKEMVQIQHEVAVGDLKGISTSLRSMKHLWTGHGVDGLLRRRDDEANLVDQAGKGYRVASYIALPPLDGNQANITTNMNAPTFNEASFQPSSPAPDNLTLPPEKKIEAPPVFDAEAPVKPAPELTACLDILEHLNEPAVQAAVEDYENKVLPSTTDETQAHTFATLLLGQINDDVKASNQRRLVKLYLASQDDLGWLQENRHLMVPGTLSDTTVTIDLTDMVDLDGCPPTMQKRLLAIARYSMIKNGDSVKPRGNWTTVEYSYNQPKPALANQ